MNYSHLRDNIRLVLECSNIKNGEPRVVGEFIEKYIVDNISLVFDGFGLTSIKYSNSRKSMEDFGVIVDGKYHCFDIKTQNASTKLNMPNISSIDRISKFYTNDENIFDLIIVKYENGPNGFIVILEVLCCSLETICLENITIGNLGTGQLQLKNKHIVLDTNVSRAEWKAVFKQRVYNFYNKEAKKAQERASKSLSMFGVL